MGIIAADLFVTLDGVYQAPGGPEEDEEHGFPYGGWQAPYLDDENGADIMAGIDRLDALLLGRKTYDIFAAYWPQQSGPIAEKFNAVPKFVVSRTLGDAGWAGTTVLRDAAAELPAVKERFDEIHMIGSGDLLQTLLDDDLVDRLTLFVYPIAFGTGKRMFRDGVKPASFALVQPARSYSSGAIGLVYDRVGVPVTGISME
ncbi:dihydrofolate reductase family protein [Agromyces sp. NPDC058064]|uniref:dihydrofolate reductase family protein n=1 Tax=Agromyces sp. NPDC058064 TaxID=3346322 RepID=UPI0036DB5713